MSPIFKQMFNRPFKGLFKRPFKRLFIRHGFLSLPFSMLIVASGCGGSGSGGGDASEQERVACGTDTLISNEEACGKPYHMLSYEPETAVFGLYHAGITPDALNFEKKSQGTDGDTDDDDNATPAERATLAYAAISDTDGLVTLGESGKGSISLDGTVLVAPRYIPQASRAGMSVLFEKSLDADKSWLTDQNFSCSGIKTKDLSPNLPVRVKLHFSRTSDDQDQLRWNLRFLHNVFLDDNADLIDSLTGLSKLNPVDVIVDKSESAGDGFQTVIKPTIYSVAADGSVVISSGDAGRLSGFIDPGRQLLTLVETNVSGLFEMVLNCVREADNFTPVFSGSYLRSHLAVDPFSAANNASIGQLNVLTSAAASEVELYSDNPPLLQSFWSYSIDSGGAFNITGRYVDAMLSPDGQFMISTALDFSPGRFSYDMAFALRN